jgi:hypothetical protein
MIPVTFGRDFRKVFDQIVYTLGKSNDLLNAKPRTEDIKISGVDQYLNDMTAMLGDVQKQKQPDISQYLTDVNTTLKETQKQKQPDISQYFKDMTTMLGDVQKQKQPDISQYLKDMTTMLGDVQKQKQPDIGQYFKDMTTMLGDVNKQEKSPEQPIDINDVIQSMSSTNEMLLSSVTTKLTTAQESDRPDLEKMKAQASVVSQNMFDNYAKVVSLAIPDIDSLASKETNFKESTKLANEELATTIADKLQDIVRQLSPNNNATADLKEMTAQLSFGINELISEARRGNDNTNRLVQVAQS